MIWHRLAAYRSWFRPLRAAAQLVRWGGLLAAVCFSLAGADFYSEAELNAIYLNRQRADTLRAPLILLAHRTHANLLGSGAAECHQHCVWYIRDPQDATVAAWREGGVLLDHSRQAFGLRRCRLFRDGDTLAVAGDRWELRPPRAWPPQGFDPWREVHAALPPLRGGDVVEIAYTIVSRPSRQRIPSEWERILLRDPLAPTVERSVIVTLNEVLSGWARVVHDAQRIVRHYGGAPRWDLLTGNLPPGPGDADALDAPVLLFTTSDAWWPARRVLAEHYLYEEHQAALFLTALGDSLMQAHRGSRERIAAVLRQVDERCPRIPRSLLASDYYPRPLRIPWTERAADELDRALLVAALADAATLKVELFLGRTAAAGFDPALVTPLQFNRLLLRLWIAEEDRYVLIDPAGRDIERAAAAVPAETILLGIADEWARLLVADRNGHLDDYPAPGTGR